MSRKKSELKKTAEGLPGAKGGRRGRRLPAFGLILFLGVLLSGEVLASVYFVITRDLPDLKTVQDFKPPLITEFYDRNANLMGTYYTERRVMVPLSVLPAHVKNAFLAAEDADFYNHHGLDFLGILRASLANLKKGRISQGASTITQQVVKNLLLSRERTIERKLREMILARRLENHMKKDDILFIYINLSFFGSRAYGVEEAARTYFGVPAKDLDVAQSAMLAGLVQAPGRLTPRVNVDKVRKRQEWVLDQMAEHGFITAEQAETAKAETIALNDPPDPPPPEAPYFQDEVKREAIRILGEKEFLRGGFKIYTTLDPTLQAEAEAAVRRGAERLDRRFRRGGAEIKVLSAEAQEKYLAQETARIFAHPLQAGEVVEALITGVDRGRLDLMVGDQPAVMTLSSISSRERRSLSKAAGGGVAPAGGLFRSRVVRLDQSPLPLLPAPYPEVEGAIVSIDPQTRQVMALVGGYDYDKSEFNRATQSRRPPGSAMKPIVYSAAFSTGEFTPASVVCDCPQSFTDDGVHFWKPHNFSFNFHGPITLHTALVHSINVATAALADKIGIQAVINRAHEMGLTEAFPFALSISLGSYGVSLLELTNAYAVFASYGLYKPPVLITLIEDRDGQIIYADRGLPLRVLSPEEAFLMIHLLNHVVNDGTGRPALALGRPAAGKTGTTSDFRDAWFIGFTPELVTGVWVGRDDFQPIGYGATGGHSALPIWLDYERVALRDRPETWFAAPEGVDIARLDPVGSGLPGTEEKEEEEMPTEFNRKTALEKSLVANNRAAVETDPRKKAAMLAAESTADISDQVKATDFARVFMKTEPGPAHSDSVTSAENHPPDFSRRKTKPGLGEKKKPEPPPAEGPGLSPIPPSN